ncbi:allantoicase [Spiractinospora alimapuensis]|uniref:allantoicase n=1 Tax=Spiractinospora alimapuensis TaxID=2820884 RepID=UPI001EEC6048|nr:allantoicase [Spiractinospora alimapuensis]QVQ51809.1 allantoicase [Spiractinospora alimapuensis]
MSDQEFLRYPDLASRTLGGAVVHANDEAFAERENLIRPGRATFDASDFGHKGKVYDGWETRRRRTPGSDWAIVRLGVPGLVRGVVVDTSWFKGNYPPEISVEATGVEGYPTNAELEAATWTTLVPRSPVGGDRDNLFAISPESEAGSRRYTHVRISMHPDGGIARFRVHGTPVTDPRLLVTGGLDLAALENGGLIAGCSDEFYSSPTNLIGPGQSRNMGEGWENARRRDDGNDWVEFDLAGQGHIRLLEVDTSYYLFNAPGAVSLEGCDASSADPGRPDSWFPILDRVDVRPDTRHRIVVDSPAATRIRLNVYPDGGVARLRAHGVLTEDGYADVWLRWVNSLPTSQAHGALTGLGLSPTDVESVLVTRPASKLAELPAILAEAVRATRPVS